jgi:GMP reductase
MHRFDIDIQRFIEDANRESWPIISASLGVKSVDKQILSNLRASGARVDFLTIDIAHGHLELMRSMLECCKTNLPETKIIAGNVATPQGVADLANWGADIVKVGIGQGSPCTTKDKTGFTLPMFTCVQACSGIFSGDGFSESHRVPIIADGGVKCNGDIAKALVAGADFVMAGGIFACCVDSAAHSIMVEGSLHRAYYGSASFENKKTKTHIEGTLKNIPSCGLTFKDKLVEIEEDLQSSISYSGGKDLTSLDKSVKYRAL